MDKVGIGIIGAGYAGLMHAEAISRDERARLIAIADPSKEAIRAFSSKYSVNEYTDYHELVDDHDVDAIFVASPNGLHAEHALYAVSRSKSVFSEKPMAIALGDARGIAEEVAKRGTIYQFGLTRRFWPVYKFVKSLIERKELVPYLADIKMARGDLSKPSWVKDTSISGGFLRESVIHVLDLSRWFLGDIVEVRCLARRSVYEQLDDFAITTIHNGDRIATVTSSGHASWAFPFERVELFGDHSCVMTEESNRVLFSPGNEAEMTAKDYSQLPRLIALGFLEEDQAFISSIVNKSKPPVTEKDALSAMEIVSACYESAEKDKPVRLASTGRYD